MCCLWEIIVLHCAAFCGKAMLVARSGEVKAAYETSKVLGRGSFGAWARLWCAVRRSPGCFQVDKLKSRWLMMI